VAAGVLRLVQGLVGTAKQRFRVLGVNGKHRDAERDADRSQRRAALLERKALYPLPKRLRLSPRVLDRDLGQDERELLASIATRHIAAAHAAVEQRGQLGKDQVSCLVPEVVVDALDVVDGDQDGSRGGAVASGPRV